ncbi:MAG TPA: plasma-membrane proton-efflux P-type ATPase [Gemmata sp.]|nr:plasma-membrane proton-efflux P-type ATPase [Gemmata sp.]
MAESLATEAGLSSEAARERLHEYGPNAVPEVRQPSILLWLGKLWGPVPWMLEFALVLEVVLGRYMQGIIVGVLLLLNATISFAQESRAKSALALLKSKLEVTARVRRDGTWQVLPATILVPGDLVHVRTGDFVPADLKLLDGAISLDQSALTGESATVEAADGAPALAGSVVRRGEARGIVTATGTRTTFGQTAALVHSARAPSHLEKIVVGVVRYLVVFVAFLVAMVVIYAAVRGLPWMEVASFALILVVAAVPVALPATYTLAGSVGALQLSGRGVLVTRLAAIEDAAAMEVLCSDKTGTLTENRLSFAGLHAVPPHDEEELLRAAAMACDEATQDPLDLAILAEADRRALSRDIRERLSFTPFDPATKRSEAVVRGIEGTRRMVKGAPAVVASLAVHPPDLTEQIEAMSGTGARVLAVAAGPNDALELLGIIALRDPPREDAARVVRELHALGIRVLMVTGDSAATARSVAKEVGITGQVCPPERLHTTQPLPLECQVFAGVYPQDKVRLVEEFQNQGSVVGMTGDGVNDAPALRQAEVGIAVAGAVDVAKAAAGMVLTRAGLAEVVDAIRSGREIHQRMLTYTLNKIVKTFQISLLLAGGLLATGPFVTTPLLILLLLFANDFVTMSLAADRVRPSPRPDRWDVRAISVVGFGIATAWLVLSAVIYWAGRDLLGFELGQLQTLMFVTLVFTGYANVYLIRERRHIWASRPGRWLLASSAAGAIVVSILATTGFLVTPLPAWTLAVLFGLVVCYLLVLDEVKVAGLRALGLSADEERRGG